MTLDYSEKEKKIHTVTILVGRDQGFSLNVSSVAQAVVGDNVFQLNIEEH